jgi:hypothetical protein
MGLRLLGVAEEMDRHAIPAELRRAVLVEAGHRCAVPRCGHTDVDVHHIVPWETCKKHEYDNLIALCPNCHRRAHKGEIDRKSLREYKSLLEAVFRSPEAPGFAAPAIEIKRQLAETDAAVPGFRFNFEFPDFNEPAARIVSKNVEAWGNELLLEYRELQATYKPDINYPNPPPNWLRGTYRLVRRDSHVISVLYGIERYYSGAAHRSRETRVQNFLISPFQPLTLEELLISDESLHGLAEKIGGLLLAGDKRRSEEWVKSGTRPEAENFQRFTVDEYGFEFIFSEYQIDCYAAGEQTLYLPFAELNGIFRDELLRRLAQHDEPWH